MQKQDIINLMINSPAEIGHKLGFTDLTELHNEWMKRMIQGEEDETLQAHRGSYKTTCVSIAISIMIVLFPQERMLFLRKTDSDIKEVIRQVKKILRTDLFKSLCFLIWGVGLKLQTDTQNEITTNLVTDTRGTSQLVGMGINCSLTGKHFDRIFTDDIVNVKDRVSKAERDSTKLIYQELQNIKNRGGRIFNTGTPWHKDDAFSIMPNAIKYDCYTTGLIGEKELEELKEQMTPSLFSANYELKHIPDESIIFFEPITDGDEAEAEQGTAHIDAAYGGEDYTAFTICNRKNGKYYVLGKLWRKHIDDCEDEIIALRQRFNAGKIHCEDNGDKGYLGKQLRRRGERVVIYHESMNKFLKITAYLKPVWKDVVFVKGTDKAYIEQICDFNENAEHDDAPDSLASIVRVLSRKGNEDYTPIF